VEASPASAGRLNSFLRRQPSMDPDRELHALWGSSLPPDVEDRGPANGVKNCFAAAAGCNQQQPEVRPPTQGVCLGAAVAAAGVCRLEDVELSHSPGTSAAAAASPSGRSCLAGASGWRQEQQDNSEPPGGAAGAAPAPAAAGIRTWRSFSAVPAREGPKELEGSEAAAVGVAGGRKQDTVIIQVRRHVAACKGCT
jgi:hypothetical protein